MRVRRKIVHAEEVAKMNVILFLSYTAFYLPGKNEQASSKPRAILNT